MNRYPSIRKLSRFERFAQFYGYPPCCLNSFIMGRSFRSCVDQYNLDIKNLPEWAMSGFVPCEKCEPEASADFSGFVLKHISPFRRAGLPVGMEIHSFLIRKR